MSMSLGLVPEDLTVNLTTGADFTCTLVLNEDWPVGATLKLVFDASEWSATISGRDATFSVDKATADAVANGADVSLVYTNGTNDEVWATGTVTRHG